MAKQSLPPIMYLSKKAWEIGFLWSGLFFGILCSFFLGSVHPSYDALQWANPPGVTGSFSAEK